ncbi:unnamed protein product [Anisakis simplex]|uniref:Zinc metalloproteinase n=1 Tax=Anisakis simplex TaxID=6269 RepID=A0A0M3K1Z3_ANISI|nr:unnamed protein product [Anisakis simplex]
MACQFFLNVLVVALTAIHLSDEHKMLTRAQAVVGHNASSPKMENHERNTSANLGRKSLVMRFKRQAYRDSNYPRTIWSDGPVPFTIDSRLPKHARSIVLKSVAFWRDNTCIDFAFNGRGRNSIAFIRGKGCYSSIGRVWYARSQALSVGQECEHSPNYRIMHFLQFHTITHELAHALGIFHTQSRTDRDRYVTIISGNAEHSQRSNFIAESSRVSENYGIPYEYGSVMHYRNHEFSVNNYPTVVARDPLHRQTMGSGTGPSFLDVLLVNKHYNCLDRCKKYNTSCVNGGYPHPRRCDYCMCPSGFGGRFCETKVALLQRIINAFP